MARAPRAAAVAAASRGQEQIVQGLDDARRAAAARLPQRADRRRRPARRCSRRMRGAGELPAGGHAGEGLGDAARRESRRGARARDARVRTRSTSRPTSRSRRSRRSAPPSTCRSTSTSRRRTRSAVSCACTRFPRSCASPRRSTQVRPAQRARRLSRGVAPRGRHRRAHARAGAARPARARAARALGRDATTSELGADGLALPLT